MAVLLSNTNFIIGQTCGTFLPISARRKLWRANREARFAI